MQLCAILVLLLLCIMILLYIIKRSFTHVINGGVGDDYELFAMQLNDPNLSVDKLVHITDSVKDTIIKLDKMKHAADNPDRYDIIINKYYNLYKDTNVINIMPRIISSLYTYTDLYMTRSLASNLLNIYTKINNHKNNIDTLINQLKLFLDRTSSIYPPPPPSTPPPPPPTHTLPPPPPPTNTLPPSASTLTMQMPSPLTHTLPPPPPPTHMLPPPPPPPPPTHTLPPSASTLTKSSIPQQIRPSPIAIPASKTGIVFPGTNISVDAYDEYSLIDKYIELWKKNEPINYFDFKSKCCEDRKDIFTQIDRKQAKNVLSTDSKLNTFARTLISAAAANLKTNNGYIIQNIDYVNSFIIVGDLHGDLPSLILCLRKYISALHNDSSTCLVFLGDYIDRGAASADIIFILSVIKSMFPSRVYLCRGNHEDATAYKFGGNWTGQTMLNSLTSRADTIEEAFYAYIAFIIFICSLSCIVTNKGFICMHGGFSNGFTYDTYIDKKLTFVPSPISTRNNIMCLLWEDYPYVSKDDRNTGCTNLGSTGFYQMLYSHGFNGFAKGHVHNAAGSYIHDERMIETEEEFKESYIDYYIIISSIFMVLNTVEGRVEYTIEEGNDTISNETIPFDNEYEKAYSATVLLVNFDQRGNKQESFSILDGIDNEYMEYIHADIIAYYEENFPSMYSVRRIDKDLMSCFKPDPSKLPKIKYDTFKTLHDVINALNVAEGRS